MNELEKIEFEIEKVKARIMQYQRISKVLELPTETVEVEINKMLETLSELIRRQKKITK